MEEKVLKKHRAFMEDARGFAERHSKDRSAKVGCLILAQDGSPLSWGYNGFPRGANDDEEKRHERPLKYLWSEHAERNAIYNAARSGHRLLGSTMYVSSMPCCNDCARGALQAGVAEIVMESSAFDGSNPRAEAWLKDWSVTKEMLEECGVKITII